MEPRLNTGHEYRGENRAVPFAFESPFLRTRQLLDGIAPGLPEISMRLGEPQHGFPEFVSEIIALHGEAFCVYPPSSGIASLRAAIFDWLKARYALTGLATKQIGIVPLCGSREGLGLACVAARDYLTGRGKGFARAPRVLLPNPFYAAYAFAACLAGAEPVFLDCGARDGGLPDLDRLDRECLDDCIALYIASPANPQGGVMDMARWRAVLALAEKHRFMVFADECYSEIYRDQPPVGILQAARASDSFAWAVTFNSLSKRSGAPGLRCGLAAGDVEFLRCFAALRAVGAAQIPVPIQHAAAALLRDETHVAEGRARYNHKFRLAARAFGEAAMATPPGGFFLWLDVSRFGGGTTFARDLYASQGVSVIPGSYLSADISGHNPGENFVRVALVAGEAETGEALHRMARFMEAGL